MTAFPPQRSYASIPVSQEIALKQIQEFLLATEKHAHFRPNARLEATGPTASEEPSITIHNLKRVEAGLRGEWLEPIIDLAEDALKVSSGGAFLAPDGDKMDVEGWQDLEEYQREQSIEVGDAASNVVVMEQEDDKMEDATMPNSKKSSQPVDKVARKAEKRRRLKEQSKRKQQEKLKERAADESD
ncbi:hypothetical protein BJ878DRAFT_42321 [Calycina marina]|uniref:Uncharacterized protein n=1 Tax=Calycina marina TaxID=1763456 RepID=A0A9P8CFL4_9HELO|nr:hypothetical protein BJ878DRAFT_42321 [Calycina marina]